MYRVILCRGYRLRFINFVPSNTPPTAGTPKPIRGAGAPQGTIALIILALIVTALILNKRW
jgi:hypothetical protein